MTIGWHRPTRAVVRLQAITNNVAQEVARLTDDTELFAVVKADGYGHGAVATAQAAVRGGATGFCVAVLDEGIELRQAGFQEPILILSVVAPEYAPLLIEYDLAVTVISYAWLAQAESYLTQPAVNALRIHLKVDTGMGRIGFTTLAELEQTINYLHTSAFLSWEGLFTHFATADAVDETRYLLQAERFQQILDALPELPRYIHTSNSAAALWHQPVGNMIRFGVAMYGLNPSGTALSETYTLEPALSLESQLIQVKLVPKGETIGYGATYTASTDEWIGTLPIGYADGWLRNMQGFSVLVDGQFCEIVGRVCMDQCMIRLPEAVAVGAKVTLIGTDGTQTIHMQDVADFQGTIHYEVACTLSHRIPRIYREEENYG